MRWILSRRNKKESIYTDGHGAYTVITHSRGICNEKTIPPFATKKGREGFNEIFPPSAIEKCPTYRNRDFGRYRPIATDNQAQNRHTSSIQSDTEELQSKGYKYLSQANKTSVFLF